MCAESRLNGQSDDRLIWRPVNVLASDLWRQRHMPDLLAGSNSVQCANDHLPRPGAVSVFGQAVLQQLRICQDDPQLVDQQVEQFCQVTVRNSGLRVQSGHDEVQAVRRRFCSSRDTPRGALASRQRVSVKMRTEPPAVLTYSTFPLEIQL